MVYKITKILAFFILFISLFQSFTISAKASSFVLEDEFDDNVINDAIWEAKNFAVEESGTNSPFSEFLLSEISGEVKISGIKTTDTVNINGTVVGNIGKSLITKDYLNVDDVLTLSTNAKTLNDVVGHEMILFLEIDENNRVLLNLQRVLEGRFAQFVFEESDEIRCPTNNQPSGCFITPHQYNTNDQMELKIVINSTENTITGYINDIQVGWGIFKTDFDNFKVGIAATGRVKNSEIDIRFDNIEATIPDPQAQDLLVPDLKQFSNPWGQLTYDGASSWASSNPTISRWGCALTSASMVLQYYNFDTDPEKLNNWLKQQNDGYTRNGGIMWPTVSRWSKLNNGNNKPVLEFSYHNPATEFLANELDEKRPPILKLQKENGGTHFIVAKGKNETDFRVNDPGTETNTLNLLSQAESKWGETVKIGRFTPSNTDLSYIVLQVNEGFTLAVYDTVGNLISEGYEIEGPLYSDDNEPKTVETLNAFYLPKPTAGHYKVEVVGTGHYQLDTYLYDVNGDSSSESFRDTLENTKVNTYDLHFDKDNSLLSDAFEISFSSLIHEWEKGYSEGKIENFGLYRLVMEFLMIAEKSLNKGKPDLTIKFLKSGIDILNFHSSRRLDLVFAQNFQTKILILINLI